MQTSWRTPLVALVCGCVIMSISSGIRCGFGLLLRPISVAYGWGREVFSISIELQYLMWGALGAAAGGFADRYGAGRVVATAAICHVLAVIGMACIAIPWLLPVNSAFLLGGA